MSSDRRTIDFVVPRMYVALPNVGTADVSFNESDSPVERSLCADLLVFYAFDLDSHYQLVANRDLPSLGMTEPELHERSIANLRGLNLEVRLHQGPKVAMLTAGGNYEATLILLPELWDQLGGIFPGTVVASIPARDMLLFTGDGSPENVAELRRVTSKSIETADKPLSRAFLRRSESGWEKYTGFAD